ncbi:hypothetical protein H257_09959 [Aphanomyces astaci]|uniref:Nucleolar protein 12 n=1 Tax=Aphanomyces astaci TaxID=112090 RepID=W4G9Q9_APHAT|nr:hypothetical protein H257_09959 [Aphanomyces astaci]ETV76011.1 hypothetical protein H257_09959 [Aphanomyces astaci]KAF0745823.1 hypothetical protein AaE_008379 [Aphanomyces astaci]|eukprot:XP_009834653.1 hypothetical protein H257_09959 [Aphanomyces astaci]
MKPQKGGAKRTSKPKSKLIVTFDADKRKDYLTGFHKRKQDRRRFGHDMEAFKKQKALIEARKIRKAEQHELMASLPEVANVKPVATDGDTEVVDFDDAHTQGKFGDVVTVTTSVGELKSDSEDELDDEEHELLLAALAKKKDRANQKQKNHLTLFQRVQLKRKGVALPTKRSKIKAAKQNAKRNGKSQATAVLAKKGKDAGDDKGVDKRKGFHKARKGGKHTA